MFPISKKALTATAGAIALAASLAATSTPASAQNFGAGLALGLVGGAIAGAAIASQPVYAAPAYGYAAPVYGYASSCELRQRPIVDAWGNVVGYRRPVRVCY